jgi:hypothetical protein
MTFEARRMVEEAAKAWKIGSSEERIERVCQETVVQHRRDEDTCR